MSLHVPQWEHRLKINGINLNYMVVGQGEPLVMIQGFSADQSLWKSQLPAFKKQYQVITFDNRGVVKSDKPKVHILLK